MSAAGNKDLRGAEARAAINDLRLLKIVEHLFQAQKHQAIVILSKDEPDAKEDYESSQQAVIDNLTEASANIAELLSLLQKRVAAIVSESDANDTA